MRDPGSPGDLSPGVVPQGKKVDGRRCGKSIEAQPSFGQIKPREVVCEAFPDSPGRRNGDTLRTRDTPGRPTAFFRRRPQQADTEETWLPSWHPLLGLCRVGPKETSMVLHDGRRARSAADDPILAALAVGAGQQHGHTARRAPAMRPSTRAPLHPERGVALHPRVRDRAREGRNGKAGSSEADEPGPKGDAQLSWPFIETSDATQVVASGQALWCAPRFTGQLAGWVKRSGA